MQHPERMRILLVDGHRKADFYRELVSAVDADWGAIAPPELWRPIKADLVIVNDETWPHCAAALPELHRQVIPTLHLIDGILEWRNVWENPRPNAEGEGLRLFQPVLSDKIACLGHAQARWLESWGNHGKCEVTGSPRFDPLIGRRPRVRKAGEAWRVLIATARTPGFTPDQRARIRESLQDLARWFTSHPSSGGVALSPVWRLTEGLDRDIGVDNERGNPPLADQLASVDAMIATPSTVLIEGMLSGLPVALLDYLNRPQYVPAAWTITAPGQLAETLCDLMTPSAARLRYQDTVLHDNLECRTPASDRVRAVMQSLVEAGRRCRAAGAALTVPSRILPRDDRGRAPEVDDLEADARHPAFSEPDIAALQAEVAHLRAVVRDRPTHMAYRLIARWQRQAEDRLKRVWERRER